MNLNTLLWIGVILTFVVCAVWFSDNDNDPNSW